MGTDTLLLFCCLLISGGHGRPRAHELPSHAISEDSNAKYEVYVPDGRGEMAQQLLTLPEIRTLLARQADNPADSDIISLEGGKRLMETVMLPSLPTSKVGVSDVISSVRSIMASEMAQHEQQQLQPEKVVVVQAQASPADEVATSIVASEAQTDAALLPESTEGSPEESTPSVVDSALDSDVSYTPVQRQDHHHGEHHGEHHEHHGEHHHHHHEHDHPAAVFEPLPKDSIGLLATNQAQDRELNDLTVSSNKIAWQVWNDAVKSRSIEDNQVFSPLALTSALGISFLGARGSSAEAIDDALGLDRLTSRNPHLHLQQVAKDVDVSEHFQSTQSHTIYVDEKRGKVQDVFKARLDTLYGAATTNNLTEVRRMVARLYPDDVAGKEQEGLRSPFGIISTATLNAAWPSSTVPSGQEEEYLQFLNLPSSAQVAAGRKLVAVPTIRTAGHFYAGYNAELDATAVAVPLHPIRDGEASVWASSDALDQAGHLSLVLVMPGSSTKFSAGGSGLSSLEARLASQEDGWDHLLRQTQPHHLIVEMPKLFDSGRMNLTESIRTAEGGRLASLFDKKKADFSAISAAKPLYLSDVIQLARLNISSVATLAGGDEITGRSADAKKKTVAKPNNNKGKEVNKAKATKVQVTVKAPCQEAIEKAVADAMAAHIKKTQQLNKAKPAPAVKKPADKPAGKPVAEPPVKPVSLKQSLAQTKPTKKPVVKQSTAKPKTTARPKTTTRPTTTSRPSTTTRPRPSVQQKQPTSRPTTRPSTTTRPRPSVQQKQTSTRPTTKPTTRPTTTTTRPRPNVQQQQPTSRPTTRPTTPTRPSTTTRPRPNVQQQQPTSRPTTPTRPSTTTRPRPNVQQQQPSKKPAAASTTTKKPTTPSTAFTRPRPNVQQTTKKPVPSSTKKPASSTKKPVGTTKKPAGTTKKPVTTSTTPEPVTTSTTPVPVETTTPALPAKRTTAKPKTTPKTPCPLLIHKQQQQSASAKKPNNNKQTTKKTADAGGYKKAGRMERATTEEAHQVQRLSFNRAFLYAVRHNPTGLLLMVGRYVHPDQ